MCTRAPDEHLLHECGRHEDEVVLGETKLVVGDVVDLHQLVRREALQ